MFFDQAFLNCSAENEVSHINHSRNTQDSVSTTVSTISVDKNVSGDYMSNLMNSDLVPDVFRDTQDNVSIGVPTISVEFRNTQDNVSTVVSTVSVDNNFSFDCNSSMNSDFEQYDSRNTHDSASTVMSAVMSKVSSDRTFLYSNIPSDFENTYDNILVVSRDRTSVGSVSTISSDRTLLYGNITSPAESNDNNSEGNESSMSAKRTLFKK